MGVELFCMLLVMILLFCLNIIDRFDTLQWLSEERQIIISMIILLVFIYVYNTTLLEYFNK